MRISPKEAVQIALQIVAPPFRRSIVLLRLNKRFCPFLYVWQDHSTTASPFDITVPVPKSNALYELSGVTPWHTSTAIAISGFIP